MRTVVTSDHIVLDDRGVAWINGTNTKVVEVVLDKLAHGSSAEEIHFQHPHLSIAKIYSALAYYHDHQSELDEHIARDLEEVRHLTVSAAESPGRLRLRSTGHLP